MGTSAKILVVDDDPDMRETLQMILESGGYTVVLAEDGEQCLAVLKEERPDMLILDLLMPKMDGFEVCKALKDPRLAKYADIPIIILSSVQEDVSQRRYELETGVQLDVDDYVEKPVEGSVLLRRVGRIIKRVGK
ncbi:MAG: response regulator [Deltaproteobacteria bacterium]|jgi:CheY-like chemotaxis protein|nr:response regulator [Deltaproteobacteria bacterium]MBW2266082.1 response regulator [Deltaproteobacteria bacterium]MBW2318505.1 response regulator [Deltaproteobacteria bacterium]MBW2601776.1 response regulator [Deltaproteobacteria bacterium]